MGIMTCPRCKGEKVVDKETGSNIDFKMGVTSDRKAVQCPECKGLGYKECKAW